MRSPVSARRFEKSLLAALAALAFILITANLLLSAHHRVAPLVVHEGTART